MNCIDPASIVFIRIVALLSLLLLGLPLTLVPLAWARRLGWRIPAETELAVYFGRCLGAVICVLAVNAAFAAQDFGKLELYYGIITPCFGLMVLVHVWGAVRRIQPPAETVEIVVWLTLFVLAFKFYPAFEACSR